MTENVKLELVRLGDLQPMEANPRKMTEAQRAALRRSLEQYGFAEPIVVRAEDLRVIGGHHRAEVWREILVDRGEDADEARVPAALVRGLDDARARALGLALNRITGEWDWALLAEALRDLPAEIETGFGEDEVESILSLAAASADDAISAADAMGAAKAAGFEDAGDRGGKEEDDPAERPERLVLQLPRALAEDLRGALAARGWDEGNDETLAEAVRELLKDAEKGAGV